MLNWRKRKRKESSDYQGMYFQFHQFSMNFCSHRQTETFEERRQLALKLKTEVDKGMQKWSEKVVAVQINNIKKAKETAEKVRNEKELKFREERINRETRVIQKRSESKEREKKELIDKLQIIEKKKLKVNQYTKLPKPSISNLRLTLSSDRENIQWTGKDRGPSLLKC